MNKVIIVQARMTSTRLPGKILKTVLGKPLLEYQIERMKRVAAADEIVIATTLNETDNPVVALCERLDVKCFRGSEEDVLSRYHGAAALYEADAVIRITSDCPLIDPVVIDTVINGFTENYPTYDYVSNIIKRSYPRGMDTEVFSFSALQEAYLEATAQPDREHVTPYIWMQPQRYRQHHIVYPTDETRHRWTVDTPEDFELIKRIIEYFYPYKPDFSLEDVLQLLEDNPDWSKLNAHIEQKQYGK